MSRQNFVASLFIFVVLSCNGFAIQPEYRIYSSENFESSDFYISTRTHEPDLPAIKSLKMDDFDGKLSCHVGGWIGYSGANYTGTGFEYDNWDTLDCFVVSPMYNQAIRYAGVPGDATAPALSFFSGQYFVGEQRVISQSTLAINFLSVSVYKSGNLPWTLYSGPNYSGDSVCIPTNQDVIGQLRFSVGSARIGCLSPNRIPQQNARGVGNRKN